MCNTDGKVCKYDVTSVMYDEITNGRLIVHAVIRQMAGATGPRSYFRFFRTSQSTATYNGL